MNMRYARFESLVNTERIKTLFVNKELNDWFESLVNRKL